jgi:hypothetical protein
LLLPGLIVLSLVLAGPGGASAQSSAPTSADPTASPPPLGDVVITDTLTQPGLGAADYCQSGLAGHVVTDEGLTFRMTGSCYRYIPDYVYDYADFRGLVMADGEIRVEARVLSAGDRAGIRLYFRTPEPLNANGGYALVVQPGSDRVAFVRQGSAETGDREQLLAIREGIGKKLGSGAWTSITVRMQGGNFWAFVDDALVLSASDDQYPSGGAGVIVARFTDNTDETELAVVVRNAKVTALADGDPARAPMLTVPTPPPDAPALGNVVIDDPLTTPAVFPPFTCPTGLSVGENVGEGLIIKIHGRCEWDAPRTGLLLRAPGLTILDGDTAVDFRILQGGPRTLVGLTVRERQGGSLTAWVNPNTGIAGLTRTVDGSTETIASRIDAHRLASRNDWNRVAVRTRGSEAWVLLNGQPFLHTSAATVGVGSVEVAVLRDGNLDDPEEAAVVFRNLTVTTLSGGDQVRAPTYQAP